jgi:4-carboxymuconolactone decarboxylase
MTVRRKILQLAALALAVAAAGTAAAQTGTQLPADIDESSLARLPHLKRKDVTEETGQQVFDIFDRSKGRSPDDTLGGPLAFAMYNPHVAKALLDLHDGAVGKGTLDAHARELAILVACRETSYDFEWNGHVPAALKAGVPQSVIDTVRNGGALTGMSERDAAVVRFGTELLRNRRMESSTFAKAVELFGKNGAMDLVAVMSTYAVSGFYAIAVDEHMPAGQPTMRK